MLNQVMTIMVSAVLGGSGIVGILFYFIRAYIEKKLAAKEKEREAIELRKLEEEKKHKELRMKRLKVDDELQHCEGRLFFWLHRAIITGEHNGDLEAAFEAYQKAEEAKKVLDREIVVENEYED